MGLEAKGGLMIRSVDPGSFAEDIGLVEKDVILAINRKPVSTVEDVLKIQSSLKPETRSRSTFCGPRRPAEAMRRSGTASLFREHCHRSKTGRRELPSRDRKGVGAFTSSSTVDP